VLPNNGVVDGNFSVFTTAVPAPYQAITYINAAYYQPTLADAADWITTALNGVPTNALGEFDYTETFTANVTGSVTITGDWYTDDCGALVAPGTITSGGTIGGGLACTSDTFHNFNNPTPFSIVMPVIGGNNYSLEFEVENTLGATGLLVTNLTGTCTQGSACTSTAPEPSSAIMALAGLALLGIGTRLRWAKTLKSC
jgi:hypothetical protein